MITMQEATIAAAWIQTIGAQQMTLSQSGWKKLLAEVNAKDFQDLIGILTRQMLEVLEPISHEKPYVPHPGERKFQRGDPGHPDNENGNVKQHERTND